jgi:hypothetical protein
MRQGQNIRRPRNRGSNNSANGGGSGSSRRQNVPLRHQTFDSNGPDVRIRGNAFQVHEKYLALARDAHSAGDRIAAENYLQHAEHYFRIITQINEASGEAQRGRGERPAGTGPQPGPGNPEAEEEGEDEEMDGRAVMTA